MFHSKRFVFEELTFIASFCGTLIEFISTLRACEWACTSIGDSRTYSSLAMFVFSSADMFC